ncbi:hypothetical protein VMCG_10334 [Cytospora schulzeri]|uniref:F-box domain-containing protein n=1 Tax=Cytospora schulzeri TaxID=448051 RepID=A0A423VFN7_9PEZI|nr:hypothetical protein VMCG_10334 [Valsa malicola]
MSSPDSQEKEPPVPDGTDKETVIKPIKSANRVGDDGSLTVFSKRSERQRKKHQLKRSKPRGENSSLLDLPFDILVHVLAFLRPSDVFRLSRTCRPLNVFLLVDHAALISRSIVRWRYSCLEKCIRLPVLISDIDDLHLQALLQARERQEKLDIHRRPYYQHVKPPDPSLVCTCLTCVLRWNILCLAVDFAHWQGNLDAGDPLPVIPRGRQPEWNSNLLNSHAAVVEKAVNPSLGGRASHLWYAAILEAHLDSTIRSIRRHSANKGNRRPRFRMTPSDVVSGTDDFLQRSGPPSADFPFHRDNYYMLEAYLPNRCWFKEQGRWGYMPAEQHERDLEQIKRWWNSASK